MTPADKNILESLIDKSTVSDVLDAVGDVCMEKSYHVRSTWQDVPLANAWKRVAEKIDKFRFTLPDVPGIR